MDICFQSTVEMQFCPFVLELFSIKLVFLEGKCTDLSVLHRFFHKQDPKEKKNYKKV